jgi:acyl carrier protein
MITTPTELKLQAIVAPRLKLLPEQVPLDQSLVEELSLDSFDVMEVILEIEETFAPVSIADKSAEELMTLRDVAQYIDSQRPHA